ncbi:MAG TPA: hypothetical protein VFP91_08340 [Vicinamibacterales bacterium]|nr:hypothetical protein [Vicinamibacterales bacterium]
MAVPFGTVRPGLRTNSVPEPGLEYRNPLQCLLSQGRGVARNRDFADAFDARNATIERRNQLA